MKKFRLSFRRKKEKKEYVHEVEDNEENEDDVSYLISFFLDHDDLKNRGTSDIRLFIFFYHVSLNWFLNPDQQ